MRVRSAKTPILVFTMLIILQPALWTPSQAESNQPMVGVSEESFDFGYAPQNSAVTHTYWIKNIGGDTLLIDDVKPGCGCTKAPLLTNVLAVGDSTPVDVTFSTGHYSKHVSKSSVIISNAAGVVPKLRFSAQVAPFPDSLSPVVVDPPGISLDVMRPEIQKRPWYYEIKLRNVSDQAVRAHIIDNLPEEFVEVDFPDDEIPPGKFELIRFRFHDGINETLFKRSLTFELNDEDHTRYTIPIAKDRRWGPTVSSKS